MKEKRTEAEKKKGKEGKVVRLSLLAECILSKCSAHGPERHPLV